jgi:hypothetical protein
LREATQCQYILKGRAKKKKKKKKKKEDLGFFSLGKYLSREKALKFAV